MTWTNAFDLGSCTVTLNDYTSGSAVQLYSGVLAKGGSTTGTSSGGDAFTLSVDANGVVSLDFATDNTFGDAYEILITPLYSHDFDARISGLASEALAVNVKSARGQIDASASDEGVDCLSYTVVGTGTDQVSFTPDPLDMTSLTGSRDLIGVHMETQGI